MKIISCLIVLPIFCIVSAAALTIQQHKIPVKSKVEIAAPGHVLTTDTIANFSVNITGESNSVQIGNDSIGLNEPEDKNKIRKDLNIVTITGKSNSVIVNQIDKKGKVNIKQTGNNNKVSIKQSDK
ncbi:MAG: hypothetical protein WC384_17115 [Prolixibacteraceae bacterium]|jgi:hypothetical protein